MQLRLFTSQGKERKKERKKERRNEKKRFNYLFTI